VCHQEVHNGVVFRENQCQHLQLMKGMGLILDFLPTMDIPRLEVMDRDGITIGEDIHGKMVRHIDRKVMLHVA
jgi:hypothetical protein